MAFFLVLILCLLGGCKKEKKVPDLAPLLSTVIHEVQENYIHPIEGDALKEKIVKGFLMALDPYSSYLSMKELEEFQNENEGTIAGVGIEIEVIDTKLVVTTVFPKTPAESSGVQVFDTILEINQKDLRGLDDVLKELKGEVDTPLSLTLQRGDLKPFQVFLKRQNLTIDPVLWSYDGDGIVYMRILVFNQNVGEFVKKALKKVQKKSTKGLILDLRNNPGGLLDQAVDICRFFVSSGRLVEIRSRPESGDHEFFEAVGKDWMFGVPMVVLLNKRSASASEIVAGCLKDHGRATLIGERSFGKGTVQALIPIGDYGAIKLTTASFYTPKGKPINKVGVDPDIFCQDDVMRIFKKDDPVIERARALLMTGGNALDS